MRFSKPCLALLLFVAFAVFGTAGCTRKKSAPIGARLRLARVDGISSLDPQVATDTTSLKELSRAYDTLMHFPPNSKTGSQKIRLEPLLLEERPKLFEAEKKYVFKLKKGILFQDDPCFEESEGRGRELTSTDVIYTLKRVLDPRMKLDVGSYLERVISGAAEWRAQVSEESKAFERNTPMGLRIIDRYSFSIELTHGTLKLLNWMAHPSTAIVPVEAVLKYGADLSKHVVGTGPYRLKSFDPQKRIVWVRIPGVVTQGAWRTGGESTDGMPFEEIEVALNTDAPTQWQSFLEDKLDLSPIPPREFPKAVTPSFTLSPDYKKSGYELIKLVHADVTFIAFQFRNALFQNKRLRQAISLSVPDQLLLETVYGNQGVLAQGPIPERFFDLKLGYKNPYRAFNRQKAKELLARAGYPEGQDLPELKLLTPNEPSSEQLGKFIKSVLDEIGVRVVVVLVPPTELHARVQAGEGDLWLGAWRSDLPIEEGMLLPLVGENVTGFHHATVDTLFEKLSRVGPEAERLATLKKVVEVLGEEAPWVWGVHRLSYWITRQGLGPFLSHEFDFSHSRYYLKSTVVPGEKK